MQVSLLTVDRVNRLRRQGKDVAAIARELRITAADVEEAHRVLLVPTVDDLREERAARAAVVKPSREEIEAARDRMPKKWAERLRKAEIEGGKR